MLVERPANLPACWNARNAFEKAGFRNPVQDQGCWNLNFDDFIAFYCSPLYRRLIDRWYVRILANEIFQIVKQMINNDLIIVQRILSL